MNERIKRLREYIFDKHHHALRRTAEEAGLVGFAEEMKAAGMSYQMRAAIRLKRMLEAETPVILPDERIVVTRTIKDIPSIYTEEEWDEIARTHYLHEKGDLCNISPNYEAMLRKGLGAMLDEITTRQKQGSTNVKDADLTVEQKEFLESEAICLHAIQDLILRYAAKAEAEKQGSTNVNDATLAKTLRNISCKAPQTLREALQLLRVMHFCLWEAGHYHNTLGRFDQYIYIYYVRDIESGRLTREEAKELIEEFFLMCNKDSDLYPGMQQGDNGQSIVLAGRSADGKYLFNEVSKICLEASYELELIDPKINLRVDAETPEEVFTLGSRLTQLGLGFPQYSNDDVVIPGLIRLGYSPEDARNYVVAACWEFIVPGTAVDIPNIDAVPLAECVKNATRELKQLNTFNELLSRVKFEIQARVDELCAKEHDLYIVPAPMMSLMMDGCIERAKDASLGGKYNNFGFHGTGVATAVDSLAALKKHYFDEKSVTADEIVDAIEHDFKGHEALDEKLRKDTEKFGQDVDWVDEIATELLDIFQSTLEGKVNERGGIYRAGTGTAMYYIWHATELGATPDGRKSSEMIPANYSPSLFIREKGPLSVIKSFAKPHLEKVINGGPLTLEFDQGIFRNEEAVVKLGQLVRTFIVLGGHQLQLNTISLEKLLDAKKHPEKYRNLIVRVWGWSGYFVELDECYQDHVINRIRFRQ